MPIRVPLSLFVFNAWNFPQPIVGERGVNRCRCIQIGGVLEFRFVELPAVDIHAKRYIVVDLAEELFLVYKLKVCPQSRIYFVSKRPTLGIVIDSFGVQEAGHA